MGARWRVRPARPSVQVTLLARWGLHQDVADSCARQGLSPAPAEGIPIWWSVAFVYSCGVAWHREAECFDNGAFRQRGTQLALVGLESIPLGHVGKVCLKVTASEQVRYM